MHTANINDMISNSNKGPQTHVPIASSKTKASTRPNDAAKKNEQNGATATATASTTATSTNPDSAAVAATTVTALLLTLNVSSRAVDDSGWLQQDLVWTAVHIIL